MASQIAPEVSNYNSVPISLYTFSRATPLQNGENAANFLVWRYTSADSDVTTPDYDLTYSAIPITDSGFTQSGEDVEDNVTITLPWVSAVVEMFNGTPPSDTIFLTVRQINQGDQNAFVVWTGSITEVTRKDQATAELTCETIAQSFERNGLTLAYDVNCPYYLYDPSTCKVNPADFSTVGTITALTSTTITATALGALGDTYYSGGYVEWLLDGTTDTYERRPINEQIGPSATLIGLSDGMSVGLTVNFLPGCDRACSTCQTKFNNLAECGASPSLPGNSPFDGENVF